MTKNKLPPLDEALVQQAIYDNPDLPEDFIRDAIAARNEPITDYNDVKRLFEEHKRNMLRARLEKADQAEVNGTLIDGETLFDELNRKDIDDNSVL